MEKDSSKDIETSKLESQPDLRETQIGEHGITSASRRHSIEPAVRVSDDAAEDAVAPPSKPIARQDDRSWRGLGRDIPTLLSETSSQYARHGGGRLVGVPLLMSSGAPAPIPHGGGDVAARRKESTTHEARTSPGRDDTDAIKEKAPRLWSRLNRKRRTCHICMKVCSSTERLELHMKDSHISTDDARPWLNKSQMIRRQPESPNVSSTDMERVGRPHEQHVVESPRKPGSSSDLAQTSEETWFNPRTRPDPTFPEESGLQVFFRPRSPIVRAPATRYLPSDDQHDPRILETLTPDDSTASEASRPSQMLPMYSYDTTIRQDFPAEAGSDRRSLASFDGRKSISGSSPSKTKSTMQRLRPKRSKNDPTVVDGDGNLQIKAAASPDPSFKGSDRRRTSSRPTRRASQASSSTVPKSISEWLDAQHQFKRDTPSISGEKVDNEMFLSLHKLYEGRIRNALGDSVFSTESGVCLDQTRIKALAQDISWLPICLARFAQRDACTIGDLFKNWVEHQLGETWDWWPLRQAKRPLCSGYSRVSWPSPAGTPHSVDIPDEAALALKNALTNAPNYLKNEHSSSSTENLRLLSWLSRILRRPGGSQVKASKPQRKDIDDSEVTVSESLVVSRPTGPVEPASQGQASSFELSRLSGTQPPSLPASAPSATQQQTINTPGTKNSHHTTATANQAHPSHLGHVFLCVRRGSSHVFSVITIDTSHKDSDFFHQLRVNYCTLRGMFLRCFSWWRYDKCDFYQFQKYDLNTGAPCSISYPPANSSDYDFSPRVPYPSPPVGPVSAYEFRDRFYKSCDHPHGWYLHWLQRMRHLRTSSNTIPDARDVIPLLPKKLEELNMDDGKRELFWGLYARERRGFAWVLAYGLLCNLPAIIFFFLWLFQWGHGSDLQNASVPLTMSISLSLFFLAMLREEREKDRL